MLNDASGFRRIYLATGYTDLRRGMEGLASIIKFNFQLAPHKRRSTGDHPRAVPISHAGTGNCCTPSDPGSQTG